MDFEVHEHPTLAHSRASTMSAEQVGVFIMDKALPRLLALAAPAIIH